MVNMIYRHHNDNVLDAVEICFEPAEPVTFAHYARLVGNVDRPTRGEVYVASTLDELEEGFLRLEFCDEFYKAESLVNNIASIVDTF